MFQIKVIGVCTQSIAYMFEEGFFDDPEIACTTWMINMPDKALEELVSFAESMSAEFPEREGNYDCSLAIFQIEQIKYGLDKEMSFTDEEAQKWLERYALSAVLEKGRREERFFADSLAVPLHEIKWANSKSKL